MCVIFDKNKLVKLNIGKFTYHNIDNKHLFIFPDIPSWVVFNEIEAIIFKYLLLKYPLNNINHPLIKDYSLNNQDIKNIAKNILLKLKERKIYPWPKIAFNAPDPEEYPTHIHLCLTHECNIRCKHCFISAGKKLNNELDLLKWKSGLNNVFKYIKNPYITISGGEPTTVDFLYDFIMFLKEHGSNITLYTNGVNKLDKFIDIVDDIQISLEGLSSKTHDFIRGDGNFYKTIENMKIIPRDKLNLAILILPHNFEEIKNKLRNFIIENNILLENLRLSADIENVGRATNLDKNFHNFYYNNSNDILKFISEIFNFSPRLILRNKRNCGIGISIGIDSDGNIYPCDIFFESFASIFDTDLKYKLSNIKNINRISEVSKFIKCKDCDIKYICLGGCKVKNKIKNGDYNIPDCNDKIKNIIYHKMIYDIGV